MVKFFFESTMGLGAPIRCCAAADRSRFLGPTFRERDLAIDFLTRRVTMAGKEIGLLRREYELLRLLAEHAGKVLTNRQLLGTVWGDAHGDDLELLRVHIRQLREKLGEDPHTPRYVLTDPGNGYRLKVDRT